MSDDLDKILDAMGGGDSEEEDLDAILEALMSEKKEDEEEGRGPSVSFLEAIESTEGEEQEPAFVSSVPPEGALIFGENKEEEVKVKKERRKPSLSGLKGKGLARLKIYQDVKAAPKPLRLGIFAMACVAVLAFVGVGVVFALSRNVDEVDNTHRIHPPPSGFNSANHAFVDLMVTIGNEQLILRQVLLDAAATVFYFEGEVDLARFALALTDFDGNTYRQDIGFATNQMRQQALNHTAVRFLPINPEAGGLVLTITDLETGVAVDVDLAYDGENISFARHFNHPINFDTDFIPGLSVQLTQGMFSGGGSTVSLSLSHNFNDGGIVLKEQEMVTPVTLRQGPLFLPPISGDLQVATFDNGIEIYRMDFGPLRTLGGEVSVILDGLYRYFDINDAIPIAPLLTPGDQREVSVWLDAGHSLNISGMMRQGPLFVMPLHGIRSNLVYDDYDSVWQRMEERVPTTLTASLVFTDNSGDIHRITGSVRYDNRGTDVIFDTRLNPNFEGVSGARISLEIENVFMSLPRQQYNLNLNISDIQPSAANMVRAALIEAHFVPEPHTGSPFDPFAQVYTMKMDGDNVYAIVKEARPALLDGRLHQNILIHRLSGQFIGGQFNLHSIYTSR
ncbi:MAG: hypothetical protein FWE21_07010 [Defluviitaleaceae bacterium]|nr:hypothetical protein [Defluviitaleaceae bacterium]